MSRTITACRSCDAPVIWIKHAKTGTPAPIDAEPTPDGNVMLSGDCYIVLGTAEARAEARRNGFDLHTNHFQTCKDAKRWKR